MAGNGTNRAQRTVQSQRLAALEKTVGEMQKPKYKAKFLWTIASLSFPLGWELIMPNLISPEWRVPIGWVLWCIPLILVLHNAWRYTRDKNILGIWGRTIVTLVALALFVGAASWSMIITLMPSYVVVVPGLRLDDGRRVYYLIPRGRLDLHDVDVISFEVGSFHFSEITQRRAGVPLSVFSRDVMKATFIIQAREGDFVETVDITDRPNMFPAIQLAINRKNKEVFSCESPDLPNKKGLRVCRNIDDVSSLK